MRLLKHCQFSMGVLASEEWEVLGVGSTSVPNTSLSSRYEICCIVTLHKHGHSSIVKEKKHLRGSIQATILPLASILGLRPYGP